MKIIKLTTEQTTNLIGFLNRVPVQGIQEVAAFREIIQLVQNAVAAEAKRRDKITQELNKQDGGDNTNR